MPLIPWRKLQAGLGGQGDPKDMYATIEHIQTTGVGATIDFDNLTVNNLVVKNTLKIPVGEDKYK